MFLELRTHESGKTRIVVRLGLNFSVSTFYPGGFWDKILKFSVT